MGESLFAGFGHGINLLQAEAVRAALQFWRALMI